MAITRTLICLVYEILMMNAWKLMQQIKRGGNAKKKKMQKYADQDEEERELAMIMLGHKNKVNISALIA